MKPINQKERNQHLLRFLGAYLVTASLAGFIGYSFSVNENEMGKSASEMEKQIMEQKALLKKGEETVLAKLDRAGDLDTQMDEAREEKDWEAWTRLEDEMENLFKEIDERIEALEKGRNKEDFLHPNNAKIIDLYNQIKIQRKALLTARYNLGKEIRDLQQKVDLNGGNGSGGDPCAMMRSTIQVQLNAISADMSAIASSIEDEENDGKDKRENVDRDKLGQWATRLNNLADQVRSAAQ